MVQVHPTPRSYAASCKTTSFKTFTETDTEKETKNEKEAEDLTMEVVVSNKDLTKEELYFLTKAQDVQKMTEAVDSVLEVTAWCIYLDKNADGEEVELFSMRTEDGETFATNSQTFIKAFREILDIFEPHEVQRIKVMNGVSKNNRTFVTCAYVSPLPEQASETVTETETE